MKNKKIKLQLVKSTIGSNKKQKGTISALGFRKLNSIVEKDLTPNIEGMIRKVDHLVKVLED